MDSWSSTSPESCRACCRRSITLDRFRGARVAPSPSQSPVVAVCPNLRSVAVVVADAAAAVNGESVVEAGMTMGSREVEADIQAKEKAVRAARGEASRKEQGRDAAKDAARETCRTLTAGASGEAR